MSNIKAIIFDMGGVILRTYDYSSREATAKKLGLSEEAYEALVFSSPSGMDATLGRIDEREHWRIVWQTLNVSPALQPEYETAFWAGDQLDDHLIDYLRSQKGEFTTALLSNAWSNARQMLTDKYQCMDAFDISVFSCEVGLAKPDPAIYTLILDRVGVAPEQAIFVDDNKDNIESAAAMGIHVIRYVNTDQTIREINELLKK